MTNVAADSSSASSTASGTATAEPRKGLRLVQVATAADLAASVERFLLNPDGSPTLSTKDMASDEIVSDVMSISPAQAGRWLVENGIDPDEMRVVKDVGGFKNRPIVKADVERIADDHRNNAWRFNDTPIRFTKPGWLGDGQHRLLAGYRANRTFPSRVTRGLSKADIETVDTGRVRKFSDVMSMQGHANTRQVASATKLLYHYDNGTMMTAGSQVSHAAMRRTIRKHPFVHDAVRDVGRVKTLQPSSVLGMVYTLAHEKHAKKAEYWLLNVQEGLELTRYSPVRAFRDTLLGIRGDKSKLRQVDFAALGIISFNAYLRNEEVRTFVWQGRGARAEPFPVLG